MTTKKCKYWYNPKKECMKMTKILQDNGVVNFIATFNGQKRSCEGIEIGCFFMKNSL